MREVAVSRSGLSGDAATFLACVATILELPPGQLPQLADGEDPATGWTVPRWLSGLGAGLARLADPARFSWPCMVIQRRAPRPLLRELVHRGGLRADILASGTIRVGDQVTAAEPGGEGR